MGPRMDAFAAGYRFTNHILPLVLGDLSDEDARNRSRGTEGASIAWIVGHLLHYRHNAMALLGASRPDPWAEKFHGSATDGADYPSVKELLSEWKSTSESLEAAMADIDDDYLLAGTGPPGPHGEKKRQDTLAFFVWHETYHMGQLGTIRKQLGYESTSDRATAQSKR